jgi:hypothetical protein
VHSYCSRSGPCSSAGMSTMVSTGKCTLALQSRVPLCRAYTSTSISKPP